MKFYSEVLNKFFNSEKECLEAEHDAKRKEEEKLQAKKAEIEAQRKIAEEKAAARKEIEKAIDNVTKMLVDYVEKYEKGSLVGKIILNEFGEEKNNLPKKPRNNNANEEFFNIVTNYLNI